MNEHVLHTNNAKTYLATQPGPPQPRPTRSYGPWLKGVCAVHVNSSSDHRIHRLPRKFQTSTLSCAAILPIPFPTSPAWALPTGLYTLHDATGATKLLLRLGGVRTGWSQLGLKKGGNAWQ